MPRPTIVPAMLDVGRDIVVPHAKVELHNHLDGSIRLDTIWDLMQRKRLTMPGDGSFSALKDALTVQRPVDLARFLAGFDVMYPAIAGDLDAIRRVCGEFCADKAAEGVAHVEPRISPHLMADARVGPQQTLRVLVDGLKHGAATHGIRVRPIICCVRGKPEWAAEVVDMCDQMRHDGVVGIDIVGNEAACIDKNGAMTLDPEEVRAYAKARELGIRRTAHAGEDGPADSVRLALDELHAERIGHGYHVLDDERLYARCLADGIHFEVCPTSSLMTGSIALGDVVTPAVGHPVIRFATDGANFSLNCDDSFITQSTLADEYALVRCWGLNEAHIVRANFNAARSSFLSDVEKADLMRDLRHAYGVGQADDDADAPADSAPLSR